jgi:hypothetical protein
MKEKLIAIVMVVCTLALACAGTMFIVRGQTVYLETASNNLSTLAEMIAVNSKATLAFRDPRDAEEILSTLKNEPSIVAGSIRNRSGQTLATYNRDTGHEPYQAGFVQSSHASGLGDDLLTVIKVIVLDDEVIGTVRLRADMDPMFVMLKRGTTTVIILLLLGCWGLMLLIYSSVKKSIGTIVGSGGNADRTQVFAEAEG